MAYVELNHKGEEAVFLQFTGTWYRFPYYVLTSIADQLYVTPAEFEQHWAWMHEENFYKWLDKLGNAYWKEWTAEEIKSFLQPIIGTLDAYIDYKKTKIE